jgi:tetratricopeptide (TPR) repeat protein
MRITWITVVLAASAAGDLLAQGTSQNLRLSSECIDLNKRVVAEGSKGQLAAAEALASKATVSREGRAPDGCTGFVLHNMAALLSMSGQMADAERFAERSVSALEQVYAPDDLVLLRPLSVLASTRFEQGKTAAARAAFRKMQSIRTERPADRALVHGTAAALFEAEGHLAEAEAEYLASFHAREEAGQGDKAEAGTIFVALGTLYIGEQRLDEARQALERALQIFVSAEDAVPMDRIRLLTARGVLLARQGAWPKAEQDLSEALTMADREGGRDPAAFRSLLTGYAYVLRKNHHRREARAIEARAAALPANTAISAVIDVTGLIVRPKARKP